MSLDTLISILVFILFIGLPLLNRLRRGGRSRTARRTARPPEPPRPLTQPAPATPVQVDEGDPVAQRLEEARRRVQEALGQQPAASQTPSQTPSQAPSQAPAQGPTSAPIPPQPVAGSLFGSPAPLDWQSGPEAQPSFIPRTPSKALEIIRIPRRTRSAARGQLGEEEERGERQTDRSVIDFEATDIIAGIVWHQILAEPKSGHWLRRRRNA